MKLKQKEKKLKVKITKAKLESKKQLEKLMINYFREIDESKISIENKLVYPYLDLYWEEKSRKPFFINYQGENIGFLLINNWILNKEYNANYSIAEFYISPKYRRIGIGNRVVQEIFGRYKGKWEIRQISTNSTAVNFWRKCIDNYTKGNYKELNTKSNGILETLQLFET